MNNMNNQNQIGAGIALIFAIIGFIISLYKILVYKYYYYIQTSLPPTLSPTYWSPVAGKLAPASVARSG